MAVTRSSTVGAGGIVAHRAFHALSTEWGTDIDFVAGGGGTELNGWTYAVAGAAPNTPVAEFASGKLKMGAAQAGAGAGGIQVYKDFTSDIPLSMWPEISVQRKMDMNNVTLGAGKVTPFTHYLILRNAASSRIVQVQHQLAAGGTFVTLPSCTLNTGGNENGTSNVAAWAGAFDVYDKLSLDPPDVCFYSDHPNNAGRMESISRIQGGSGITAMRNWTDQSDFTLRVMFQLRWGAGCTRAVEIEYDEASMNLYGNIS